MSEPLRKTAPAVADPALAEPLRELLPPLRVAESNDNQTAVAQREGERTMFEIPRIMWSTMVGCYALFLAALLAATGDGHATFAIVISAIYVIMFFGVTWFMLRHGPAQPHSPLHRPGAMLQTIYGPLSRREVAVQLLIVPAMVAFFGLAVLCISLAVL